MLNANKANTAIQEKHSTCISDDGENLKITTQMRQLRASQENRYRNHY